MTPQELKKFTIYQTKHGSHAYGLNTPESDLDLKGMFIAPREYYLGFMNQVEQVEEKVPNDSVTYEIRKFFKLAADCNPNIIEVLHTDEADVVICTKLGRKLRNHAQEFLSQKAKFTFAGYAHAQLARIETHYRWLKNPPQAPPQRSAYGLPEHTLIPQDHLAAAEALIQKKIDSWDIDWDPFDAAEKIRLQAQLHDFLLEIATFGGHQNNIDAMLHEAAGRANRYSRDFIDVLQAEKKFANAQREWQQYQDWLKNRNPKRAELEAKFGYDTKHGMHLVRLMKMGEEILTTGRVIVKRPDREELLAIRHHGAWKYEDLVEWAKNKDKQLEEIYRSGKSPLPKKAPYGKLDTLCMDLVKEAWERQDNTKG